MSELNINWIELAQQELRESNKDRVCITQDSAFYHPGTLYDTTQLVQEKDLAYQERNKMLVLVCRLAMADGFVVGIGEHVRACVSGREGDDWDESWRTVIYIDLPTGQVSWHIHDSEMHLFSFLPKYRGNWDLHTTEEKWDRVLSFSPRSS